MPDINWVIARRRHLAKQEAAKDDGKRETQPEKPEIVWAKVIRPTPPEPE